MKSKLVVVVGNVGSGKSTLTNLLAKELPAEKVPADDLFKTNPFFPLAVGDRTRWSLTSDIWFLYERVKMAREIPKVLKKNHVVVDSGLPMSFVYAHSRLGSGYFTDDEWELYKCLHDELTKSIRLPDMVVHLSGPIDFLRKRIEERGREFEVKFHTLEYLSSLEESLELVVGELRKKGVNVLEYRSDKVDFVGDKEQLKKIIFELKKND